MYRTASVVAALVVGLCVASARAQTPFGGDETGFIPPDAPKGPIAKCENGVAKAEGKLIACILKCHASRASGKLADDTAEDSCEMGLADKSCFANFAEAISKLKGCPSCINNTTMTDLANKLESTLDGMNGAIYCYVPTCANGGIACGSGCGMNPNCTCIGTEISGCSFEHGGSTTQPVCVTGPPGGTCNTDADCPANTACVASNPCVPSTCIGAGQCQTVCPE